MKTVFKAVLQYILFWLMYLLWIYIFKIRNRVKVEGRKNLPPVSQRYKMLFGSNHQTLVDSLLIGGGIINPWELLFHQKRIPCNAPDRINFLSGSAKYFFGLLKNIPTDRNLKTRTDIENQIQSYCQVLEKKNNLLLFFEGTRSRDGSIGPCRKGIAITILRAHPRHIIPITLIGISDIMPISVGFKWRKIKSGVRGKMIIGQPLDFSELLSSSLPEETKVDLICQEIRAAVIKNYH